MQKFLIWKKSGMHNEWSLIIFTLLAQLCVGSFLIFVVTNPGIIKQTAELNIFRNYSFFILALLCLGIFISILHLGNPGNAVNAMNNLGSSWVSKEIFSLSLFSLGLAAIILNQYLIKLRTYKYNFRLYNFNCCRVTNYRNDKAIYGSCSCKLGK